MNLKDIHLVFVDNKSYSTHSASLRDLILRSPIYEGIIPTALYIKTQLTSQTAPPLSKLLMVRFVKESVELGDYKIIKFVESEILPILMEIGKYRSDSQDDDRGKTMFLDLHKNQSDKKELQQLGHSILKLTLELIKYFDGSLNPSVYQYYPFPSMFSVVYKHLASLKVKFPSAYLYIKPADMEKFEKMYKEYTSQRLKEKMINTFIDQFSDYLLGQLKTFEKDVSVCIRLAATGDSNLIQELVEVLQQAFHKETDQANLRILEIVNLLYMTGEAELINDIRLVFIPILAHVVSGLNPTNYSAGIQHSTNSTRDLLKRFAYETVSLWEYLNNLSEYPSNVNISAYSSFLPEPSEYHFFNKELFVKEFKKNCKWKKMINAAKVKPIEAQNEEELEDISSALHKFVEAVKANQKHFSSKDFFQTLVLEIQPETSIQQLPRALSDRYVPMISQRDMGQSPQKIQPTKPITTNKPEQPISNNDIASIQQRPDSQSLRKSQVSIKSEPKVKIEQQKHQNRQQSRREFSPAQSKIIIPNTATLSQLKKGKDQVVETVQIQPSKSLFSQPFQRQNLQSNRQGSNDGKVGRTQNYPPPQPPKVPPIGIKQTTILIHSKPESAWKDKSQEQSIIQQPQIEPLESSFHQIEQTQRQIMQKIKREKEPSFMMATSSVDYKLASKINFSGTDNFQTFKNLKGKSSKKYSNMMVEQPIQNRKSQIDRLVSHMRVEYEDRIKDLEKKLSSMVEKEKSYVVRLNNQDSEIKSLKEQMSFLSKENSMMTNKNEVEYLINQNSALKSKLSHLQNSRHFPESNKKIGSNSFLPLNIDKPLGKTIPLTLNNLQLRLRKCILRNKEILYKTSAIEVGVISNKQMNGIKLTIFYTFNHNVSNFKAVVVDGDSKSKSKLRINYEEKELALVTANKQEKQNISIEFPKDLNQGFIAPVLKISYNNEPTGRQDIRLELPISLVKVGVMRKIPVDDIKAFEDKRNTIVNSEQFAYSKKIIKGIHSLPQLFPELVIVNPENEALFNNKESNIYYGYQVTLNESSFLIKIVLCPSFTLYIQAINLGKGDNQLLELYMRDMLDLLVLEGER